MPDDLLNSTRLRPAEFPGIDGNRIVGEQVGTEDASPILLLHGGGQTRHAWAGTALRLADAGYHVIAYDARGHGDSEWAADGNYSPGALVGDLKEIVRTIRGAPILIGASMGGLTSLVALGESGEDFARALVLVDIAARLEASGVARVMEFMRAHTGGFATIEDAVKVVADYNPHRRRPPSAEGLRKNLRQRDGRWYWHWDPKFLDHASRTQAGEALVQQERREAAARNIQQPTLLVRGGSSDVVSPEGAQALRELIPHAELADVAEAGHMVAGDRNDLFADAVIDFLLRHAPPNAT